MELNVNLLSNQKQIVNQEKENNECAICLLEMDKHHFLINTLCRHKFHNACLTSWFKTSSFNWNCPLCRADLSDSVKLSTKFQVQLCDKLDIAKQIVYFFFGSLHQFALNTTLELLYDDE
ncbi:MAG: E3 ubiquitin protein ligase [Shewanella sp.]|nr:E3 ubiquitin protein ligase [Shewanella sp.]